MNIKHKSTFQVLTLFLIFFVLNCSRNSSTEVDFDESPTVIEASPESETEGALARTHYGKAYDFALKFSHAMNTRLTEDAVSVTDTNSNISIRSISWKGTDLMYITLCEVHETGSCSPLNQSYQIGKEYSITLSSEAMSIYGLPFEGPEIFSYLPEPTPRILSVSGFQTQVSGSFEQIDSLPDTISMGEDISPSVALAKSNTLTLHHNKGTIVSSSLEKGVECFMNTKTLPCEKTIHAQSVNIKFTELLNSGSNFKVVLNEKLLFNTDFAFPRTQSIVWETIEFAIDTAVFFGNYRVGEDVALLLNYPRSWTWLTPNDGKSLFYASTLVDSTSINKSVSISEKFDKGNIIIQDNVFGWEPQSWLPPSTEFVFTISKGLKSKTGESLNDKLTYKVTTEDFNFVHYEMFGIQPYFTTKGERKDPVPDSIYQISNGSLVLQQNKFYQYHLKPGPPAYINLNSPIDSAELTSMFTVTPKLNYKALYNGTGVLYSTLQPVISDTIYTIKVHTALADTFGNKLAQPLEYKFQTESFELKVGNLFGVYFGPIFEEDLTQYLPGQPLPAIDTIVQGVYINAAPNTISLGEEDRFTDNLTLAYADPTFTANTESNFFIVRNFTYGDNRIVNNTIGIRSLAFHPGFSDTTNYLCFSHYPDSNVFLDYVQVSPDDGSIEIKLESNMIRFSTSDFAKPKTEYRIKIKEGMPDIHGRKLNDSVIVAFVSPDFSLIQAGINHQSLSRDSLTKNNDLGTWPTENYSFHFRTTHAISPASLATNIEITPPIPGYISANLNDVTIDAGFNLIPDTTYKVVIKKTLESIAGGEFDSTYTLNFSTETFHIKSMVSGDTSTNYAFGMLTNSKLNVSNASSFVTITPEHFATGTFTSTEDSSGFFYTPDSTPTIGNKITAIINPDFIDTYNHELDSADTLSFYWVREFGLIQFDVGNTSTQSLFSLNSTLPLDSNSFATAFEISQEKYQGGVYEFNVDSTGFTYTPPIDLELGDEVQIIVNTELMDVYGNHIEQPDTLDFIISSWSWR